MNDVESRRRPSSAQSIPAHLLHEILRRRPSVCCYEVPERGCRATAAAAAAAEREPVVWAAAHPLFGNSPRQQRRKGELMSLQSLTVV